jgi:hypothetical protein
MVDQTSMLDLLCAGMAPPDDDITNSDAKI